jgi:hypothetical protein
MVMSAQPIADAIEEVEALDPRPATRIMTSPQGVPLTQDLARDLASRPRLLIVAGRYEGIDERAMDALEPLEVSVGDVVVSGGEIPAMLLVDAVIRLLPGARTPSRSATRRVVPCSTVPTTPDPAAGGVVSFRSPCSRATTRRSTAGATSSVVFEPAIAGRTCWPPASDRSPTDHLPASEATRVQP